MTTLVPMRLAGLVDWFEDLPFVEGTRVPGSHMIRVEDRFTDHDYELRAELPGLDPDKDMRVSVDGGRLTIHAERRAESTTNGRSEFTYGRFDRSVILPRNADTGHITAAYENGVLTVTVPLAVAASSVQKIAISTSPKPVAPVVETAPGDGAPERPAE